MIFSQRCCSKLLVPQQFSDPTGTSKSQNPFTKKQCYDRTKQDYQLQRNINIGIQSTSLLLISSIHIITFVPSKFPTARPFSATQIHPDLKLP